MQPTNKTPRERIADKMVSDMLVYVVESIFPNVDLNDDRTWKEIDPESVNLTQAIGRFVAGRITYQQLEAIGVEYVDAWQRAAGKYPAPSMRPAV